MGSLAYLQVRLLGWCNIPSRKFWRREAVSDAARSQKKGLALTSLQWADAPQACVHMGCTEIAYEALA